MATKITSTDSMRQAAGKINAAFAALDGNETFEEVSQNDSMSAIAGKVQRNFAKVTDDDDIQQIASTDNMSDIADKLDNDFAIAESVEPQPSARSFSFLHASDPHGQPFSLLKDTLDTDTDCEFAILTGDLKAYGLSPLDYNVATINNSSNYNGKLMACSGNHDGWDSWDNGVTNKDNRWMSKWMHTLMGGGVNWGDTLGEGFDGAPISSYYYKDFNVNSDHPVRLIALDQFETYKKIGDTTYTSNYSSVVVMTNKQMQWFIQLLKDTPANYTIIIALHETPFYYASSYIQSLDPMAEGITAQQQIERLFMSEKVYASTYNEYPDNRYGDNGGLIVNIMKAYLAKGQFSHSYNDSSYAADGNTLVVDADFTEMQHEPAAFACYIFGHIHNDNHYWVKSDVAPMQLLLSICRANKSVNSNYDDLITTSPDQRINKVTVEFADGNTPMCVHVERIGQQATIGGRTRDELFFYYDENQTISHERITNWEGGES